jgi:hypothetical protein
MNRVCYFSQSEDFFKLWGKLPSLSKTSLCEQGKIEGGALATVFGPYPAAVSLNDVLGNGQS